DGDESAANHQCPSSPAATWGSIANRLERTRHSRGCHGTTRIQLALQAFQVAEEFRGGLVTESGILFQRPEDDVFQMGRHVRVQLSGAQRSAVQDRVED